MWQRAIDLLIRAVDWMGRVKDTYEGWPWIWRLFWVVFGPGVIVYGSYEIDLPVSGKIFFFVLCITLWSVATYYWNLHRERRAGIVPSAQPASGGATVASGASQSISVIDLAVIARDQFNWKFTPHTYEFMDFHNGLRRAHRDGRLTLQGLKGGIGSSVPQVFFQTRPPTDIPAEHFERHWIYADEFVATGNEDNTLVHTDHPAAESPVKDRYGDIRIKNGDAALNWLRDAGHLRGQYKQAQERDQAKRNQRDQKLREEQDQKAVQVTPTARGTPWTSEKFDLLTQVYRVLENEMLPHYDKWCDEVGGPWQQKLKSEGRDKYVQQADALLRQTSEGLIRLQNVLDANKIYWDLQDTFGGGPESFNNFLDRYRTFISRVQNLPAAPDDNNLKLIEDDAKAFHVAIGSHGKWVRERIKAAVNITRIESKPS